MIIVTVPVHNELNTLKKCIEILIQESEKLKEDFRIIIAEDGSTDGTRNLTKMIKSMDSRITLYTSSRKLGRGMALKRAWSEIDGDIYLFIDADLATDMEFYPELIKSIKNGNDLATGSRYKSGAIVHRPLLRYLVSRLYNKLIRIIYKDGIFDHQIGFKAFSKRLIKSQLNECKSENWFWDTEIIVLSVHRKFKVVEFPVKWEEKKRKRTPIKRLVIDIFIHGIGLIKLKTEMKNCKNKNETYQEINKSQVKNLKNLRS